jgi:hypothetical protein
MLNINIYSPFPCAGALECDNIYKRYSPGVYPWRIDVNFILTVILILLCLVVIFLLLYKSNVLQVINFDTPNMDNYVKTINPETYPKIIHLVLYSDDPIYNEMYNITRDYYHIFPNITTLYYKYDPTLREDYVLKDDILLIKGTETFIPGVLEKTLTAFHYVLTNHSDANYVIRSNISTIVNMYYLSAILKLNNINYAGSGINKLNWLDVKSGITDYKYKGLHFPSGTSIIIKMKCFKKMMKHINKIDKTIIDDVAIGAHSKYICDQIISFQKYFYWVPSDTIHEIDITKYIFYRNKHDDNRMIDIQNMKYIVNKLYKQYNENVS